MTRVTLADLMRDWMVDLAKEHPSTASNIYYDKHWGQYIQASGSTVPEEALLKISNQITNFAGDGFKYSTEYLLKGKMDLVGWQKEMAQGIKDAYIVNGQLGKGGKLQMTFSDYGKLGAQIKQEYRHLTKFAEDIAGGKLSEAQINARVALYAESTKKAYWIGKTSAMNVAGFDMERRVMSPAEHCDDCVGYAALGWQPIGSLPEPGSGSVCGGNCKCHKEYGNSAEIMAQQTGAQPPAPARQGIQPPSSVISQRKLLSTEGITADQSTRDDLAMRIFLEEKGSEWAQNSEVADLIAKRTGLNRQGVIDVINQWGKTSNDTSYRSLELQEVAKEKFGVQFSEWQTGRMEQVMKSRVPGYSGSTSTSIFETSPGNLDPYLVGNMDISASHEAVRAVLDEMYKMTQAELKAAFPKQKTITLFRGISGFTDEEMVVLKNAQAERKAVNVTSNVLESWSSDPDIAENFARRGNGIVVKAEVPIDRIHSTVRTGLGTQYEREFVLYGNVPGDQVLVTFSR